MTKKQPKNTTQQRLEIWRPLYPDFTDAEIVEAVHNIDDYLRISWKVFRSKYPDEALLNRNDVFR